MTIKNKGFYTQLLGCIIITLVSGCSFLTDKNTNNNFSATEIAKTTQIQNPTETSSPTLTPTSTPRPTPTPIGGGEGKILYTRYDSDSKTTHIYTFKSDGSEHRSVLEVDQFIGDDCFHFSPNGEKLAFVNVYPMDGDAQGARILLTDPDLLNPPIVVDDDFQNINPIDWSSDSNLIAYFGYKIDRWTLTVATLNEGKPIIETVIDPPYLNVSGNVSWSPEGNQFLFSMVWGDNWEIMIVDSEEKTIDPFISFPSREYRVNWSPDGKYISFASDRDKNYTFEQIFIMNSDGSNITNLVNDPHTDGRFHLWSPDSSRMAYLTSREYDGSSYSWSIFTVKPDGSGLARVSGDISLPKRMQWSADGKFIMFQESEFVDPRFVYSNYITAADGSTPPRLLPEWMTLDLDLSPDSLSPDGKRVVFYDEGNIYISAIDAMDKPEPIIEVDSTRSYYYYCFSWQP